MRSFRCCLVLLLAACGGSSDPLASMEVPPALRVPNAASFPLTARIPLEAGHLLLGASSADSAQLAFVIEAPRGQLVLFACDRVDARTGEEGFMLGSAGYEEANGRERLGGMIDRQALQRFARGTAPRIQTCDEEIQMTPRAALRMRAFAEGQAAPQEERIASRSIALQGLELGFAISSADPEVVRVALHVVEPMVPLEDCEFVAMVGDDTFPLGLMSLEPGRSHTREGKLLEARLPRQNVQFLAMEDEASVVVCGDIWILDRVTLENVRSLVGTPPNGATPPARLPSTR